MSLPLMTKVDRSQVDAVRQYLLGLQQRITGAIAALEQGEPFIAAQIARASTGRKIVRDGLMATGKVRMAAPAGAFYAFFTVDGHDDARRLALHLIDQANVGLAPGTAFGPGGETGLRLCYARSAADLEEATRRIAAALS